MKKDIMVSVCCLAYNHEKYIRNTLEGFINQKTDFRFEVFIHDDASTDHTKEIINEYVQKYPDVFIPIYQNENQYSKKIDILKTFVYPRMHGKYIALCEGDDYWSDNKKLQAQVDVLEENEDCIICTHVVGKIKESGEALHDQFPQLALKLEFEDGVIESNLLMRMLLEKGYIFHTSSYLYRKSMLDYRISNEPEFVQLFPVGDFALLCYAATCGNCYFINKEMSKYRVMSEGSWSKRLQGSRANIIHRYEMSIKALLSLDEYTHFEYHKEIIDSVKRNEIIVYINKRTYRKLLNCLKMVSKKRNRLKYLILGLIDLVFPDCFVKV